MITNVQSLEQTTSSSITNNACIEVSQALTGKNSGRYLSTKLDIGNIKSYISSYVEEQKQTIELTCGVLPIGSIVYLSKQLDISQLSSSILLPADGTVIQNVSTSSLVIQDHFVQRNDSPSIFDYIRQSISSYNDNVDSIYKNSVIISENSDFSIYDDKSYDGKYIYDINSVSIRLPKLDKIYLNGADSVSNNGIMLSSQCPNIYGCFANGVTFQNNQWYNDIDPGVFVYDNIELNYKQYYTQSESNVMYLAAVRHTGTCSHVKKHTKYIITNESLESLQKKYYVYSYTKYSSSTYDTIQTALSRSLKNCKIVNFNPNNATVGSLYTRNDDMIILDSISLIPYIVVNDIKMNLERIF